MFFFIASDLNLCRVVMLKSQLCNPFGFKWPFSCLIVKDETGLGKYIVGTLNVNKHLSSREAFVPRIGEKNKGTGDILISGMRDRNRAIQVVWVDLLVGLFVDWLVY